MAMRKIRVLVVDDSLMVRKTFETKLSNDPAIEVVGTAVDPFDAKDKIKILSPDVITLDVEMPKMNGIDFLKQLMAENPLPVVVVSSLPINVLDALNAGAVDFVKKPNITSPDDLNSFILEFTTKIKIASVAHVHRKILASSASTIKQSASADTSPSSHVPAAPPVPKSVPLASPNAIIAIGASTGGTEAIISVIKDLPANSPGVVIVQHMPPVFTKMYAQRIDKIANMNVKEAENGDRVVKGQVIIAAGEHHLRLCKDSSGYYVKSTIGEKVSGHCPSVDVLFDSVASVAGKNAVGVILTGMGSDGAKGLLKMRQAGAYTIGQDKESSIVYGMPMVANDIGAVMKQLPLTSITAEIVKQINHH